MFETDWDLLNRDYEALTGADHVRAHPDFAEDGTFTHIQRDQQDASLVWDNRILRDLNLEVVNQRIRRVRRNRARRDHIRTGHVGWDDPSFI